MWFVFAILSAVFAGRYYDKKYTSFNSNSFREGTSIQNEHGIFWGLNWNSHESSQYIGI